MNITSGSGQDHACGEPESALLPGALAQRQRGQDRLHPDLPLQPVHPPPHRAARLLLQRTYRTVPGFMFTASLRGFHPSVLSKHLKF